MYIRLLNFKYDSVNAFPNINMFQYNFIIMMQTVCNRRLAPVNSHKEVINLPSICLAYASSDSSLSANGKHFLEGTLLD